mmetsp:Transcript_56236/g.103176  ORF Transcript_56236/g.103176 Transcript_56236/m.103176 type:complete len:93 (-) Transcript_56236:2976-3254(-)
MSVHMDECRKRVAVVQQSLLRWECATGVSVRQAVWEATATPPPPQGSLGDAAKGEAKDGFPRKAQEPWQDGSAGIGLWKGTGSTTTRSVADQ